MVSASLLLFIACAIFHICLDLNDVIKILENYTHFELDKKTAASSSNGELESREVIKVTDSPQFKEALSWLQESSGLKRTGELSTEDVRTLKKPRCGMADPPPPGSGIAAYTEHSRWETKFNKRSGLYKLSYSFFPKTYPSDLRPDVDVEKGVLAAMCMWEWNSNVRFTANRGEGVSSADVQILFGRADHGDGFKFDGKGGTLAHAFYPENGGLHFDSDEKWYLSLDSKRNYNKKDIFTVSAHELGHTLGLGHSLTAAALMAPVYNFQNSFKEYELPHDDVSGIANMYGSPRPSRNPPSERNSACFRLQNVYGSRLKEPTFSALPTKPRPPDRRTTSTTTTIKTTTIRKKPQKTKMCQDNYALDTCNYFKSDGLCKNPSYQHIMTAKCQKTCRLCSKEEEKTCRDDTKLQANCDGWKKQGLCTSPKQGEAMSRLCRKTCGFCAETKPRKPTKTPTKAKTICDIKSFDTFITVYDYSNAFHAYVMKKEFYFPVQIQIQTTDPNLSLLDSTSSLGKQLRWRYDPKLAPPGVLKYANTDLFKKSTSIKAALWAPGFYFTFTDEGTVDEYERSGPYIIHVENSLIGDVFAGYPHTQVDAAYVERHEKKRRVYIYNIFYKNKFWQFQINNTKRSDGSRRFTMISPGKDIEKWHGVPACGVDSVFAYNGIPYFLKKNVFWPATKSEPLVFRDVSYHFFRCWDEKPNDLSVNVDCSAAPSSSGHFILTSMATLISIIVLLQ